MDKNWHHELMYCERCREFFTHAEHDFKHRTKEDLDKEAQQRKKILNEIEQAINKYPGDRLKGLNELTKTKWKEKYGKEYQPNEREKKFDPTITADKLIHKAFKDNGTGEKDSKKR